MKVVFSVILIYCLFSFKISLFGDVRLDDLLILLLATLSLKLVFKKKFYNRTTILFLLFVCSYLFSAFYNSIGERVSLFQSFLYSIRSLEYFFFIFLGYWVAKYQVNIRTVLVIYVYYAVGLVFLQSFGLIGAFSGFALDRAIANTGGPYELAAVAAFLLFFFLEARKGSLPAYASAGVLFLTASRITITAALLVFLTRYLKISLKSILVFTLLIITATVYIFTSQNTTTEGGGYLARLGEFFHDDTYISAKHIIDSAPVVESQDEYFRLTYSDALHDIVILEGDSSFLIRVRRWTILVKTVTSSFDSFMFGLGPSFAGKAVDSSYMRIFVEGGILSLTLFVLFLVSFLSNVKDKVLTSYLLVLVGTGFFIDIFFTYKAMMLLWLFYGMLIFNKGRINNEI